MREYGWFAVAVDLVVVVVGILIAIQLDAWASGARTDGSRTCIAGLLTIAEPSFLDNRGIAGAQLKYMWR